MSIAERSPLPGEVYRRLLAFTAGWRGKRAAVGALMVGRNTSGSAPPLFWCLQGYREFDQLATRLGPDHPVYGMRSAHLAMAGDYEARDVQQLAAHYVEEIQAAVPLGPCMVGGNCQGALVAFEIARRLRRIGRDVPLLCMLDSYGPEPYEGPVALLFAHRSVNNPYRYYRSPERAWHRLCPGGVSIQFTPGGYAESFVEPHAGAFVEQVRALMRQACERVPAAGVPDPRGRVLPTSAYRASFALDGTPRLVAGERAALRVTVRNLGPVAWPESSRSGIALANRWLREDGQVVRWVDGRVEFARDVAPGAAQHETLTVTSPRDAGRYVLELDLVEEGVTWFQHRGSAPLRLDVEVVGREIGAQAPDRGDAAAQARRRGARCFALGDLESAARELALAVELDPAQPFEVFCELGDALVAEGQLSAADEAYERAAALRPADGDLLFRIAVVRRRLGRGDEAIGMLERALELSPSRPSAVLRELGGVLEEGARLAEAEQAYLGARRSAPDDVDLLSDLARCLHRQDKHGDVLPVCDAGIEREPDNPHLHYLRAVALRACGRPDAAADPFQRAIELGLPSAWAHKGLGDLRLERGDGAGAIDWYRRGLTQEPGNAYLHFALAEALRAVGALGDAARSFERALELAPDHYWSATSLGAVRFANGEVDLAVAAYHAAIEIDDARPEAYRGLAEIHARAGRQDLADAYRRRAERL